VPALRDRPDAIVVMDNLPTHKAELVRAALDRVGLSRRYLPPLDSVAVQRPTSTRSSSSTATLSRVEAEDPVAGRRRPLAPSARGRARSGAAHDHRPSMAAPSSARGWFRLCGYGSAS
jgi:hypothetical protein